MWNRTREEGPPRADPDSSTGDPGPSAADLLPSYRAAPDSSTGDPGPSADDLPPSYRADPDSSTGDPGPSTGDSAETQTPAPRPSIGYPVPAQLSADAPEDDARLPPLEDVLLEDGPLSCCTFFADEDAAMPDEEERPGMMSGGLMVCVVFLTLDP